MEEYKLPAEVHNRIFEQIKKDAWEGTTSVEKPKIVILGGQPGAGKSKLIEAARSLFPDGNVVIINGDEYRKEHPKSKEIFEKHERDYAKLTDPDVRVWTKKLFDLSIETKRNIIFEGTMRTDAICDTIKHLKENGYYVAVKVAAVNEKLSKLGMIQRYEELKERIGYGRWTSPESHDAAYVGMMKTLEKIENEKLFDSLMVYNRDGKLLYENHVIHNELEKEPQAIQIMEAERNREWTLEETRSHLQTLVHVIEKMEKRNDDPRDVIEADLLSELNQKAKKTSFISDLLENANNKDKIGEKLGK